MLLPVHPTMSTLGGAVVPLQGDTEDFTIAVADASSSNTATITSATKSTTALIYAGARCDSSNTVDDFHDSLFYLEQDNDTTVSAHRNNTANGFTIAGTVIPFDTSFVTAVHHGTVTMTGSGVTSVTSSTVNATLANCAVNLLFQESDALSDEADHTLCTIELSGSDGAVSATIKRGTADAATTSIVSYQIIEFKAAAYDSIQEAEVAITNTVKTNTATITSVDTSKSITLWNGLRTTRTGSDFSQIATTVGLTDATTVTATRGVTSFDRVDTRVTVIEFADGIINSIQRIHNQFVNEAAGTTDVTITAVTLAKSYVHFLGWRWDQAAPDWTPNLNMFTVTLTSTTNAQFERFGTTSSDMYVSAEVVEFA